jgi:hypothetical protein
VNKIKHTIDLKEKDLAQLNTNLVQWGDVLANCW